jgi:hypothetical protein
MIKNKNILFFGIGPALICILLPDAHHQQKKIGPKLAKHIYKVAAFYFTKKRRYYHQWKYQ